MTSILSQEKRVFNATNSNAIISESKKIFSIFFCISGMYIKIWNTLKRKMTLRRYLFLKL